MRAISYLLIIALLAPSFAAIESAALADEQVAQTQKANPQQTADQLKLRADRLKELQDYFEAMCFEKGEFKDGAVITTPEIIQGVSKDGAPFTCNQFGYLLGVAMQRLQTDYEAFLKTMKESKDCPNCQELGNKLSETLQNENVADIETIVKKAQEEQAPKCEKNKQNWEDCIEGGACAIIRGLAGTAGGIASYVPGLEWMSKKSGIALPNADPNSVMGKTMACIDNAKGNCFTELVAGALKDLWSNVEAIWDLGKATGKFAWNKTKDVAGWSKDKVVGLWNWARGVEDKTSDAMLTAAQQEPGMIDLFKKDPLAFMKSMVGGMWDMFTDMAKEKFGCHKWSGSPHVSTCLEPMQEWDCASCEQKTNVICGIIGLAGGEILTAYLTGGATAALKVAGKAGIKGAVLLNAKILKIIPKLEKAETVAAKGLEAGLKTAQFLGRATLKGLEALEFGMKSVMFSKPGKAALKLAVKGGKIIAPVVVPATKVVVWTNKQTLGRAMQLLADATILGFKHGDQLFSKLTPAEKLKTLVVLSERANFVEFASGKKELTPAEVKSLVADASKPRTVDAGADLSNVKNWDVQLSTEQMNGKGGPEFVKDVEGRLKNNGYEFKLEEGSARSGEPSRLNVKLPDGCQPPSINLVLPPGVSPR